MTSSTRADHTGNDSRPVPILDYQLRPRTWPGVMVAAREILKGMGVGLLAGGGIGLAVLLVALLALLLAGFGFSGHAARIYFDGVGRFVIAGAAFGSVAGGLFSAAALAWD